ncbi:hypothetical protein CDD81_7225 [Ophiocordyceps australis]|uniref:Uncharacterized protein n=1 Tax=Ophiocordyceps australis TaxID=1399860 RepID=A0A2C5Y3Y5_9HYPO|nr:hypothetical protein CDD81_7225 [Ophiocordyceps australis]
MPNELFGHYLDFDADATAAVAAANDGFHAVTTADAPMAGPSESLFLVDDAQLRPADGNCSSGVSTADEFDFISPSSHFAHEIDPREMAFGEAQQYDVSGRGSMSETDLSRLESISLHSPVKNSAAASTVAVSDPTSPTPPNTTVRKPKKLVEALSSTLRKAATIRKSRRPLPDQRAGSPTPGQESHHHHQQQVQHQQQPPSHGQNGEDVSHSLPQQQQQPHQYPQLVIKPPKQRGRSRAVAHSGQSQSPPIPKQEPPRTQFVHGYCDDPFGEGQAPPGSSSTMTYYGHGGIATPLESPAIKMDPDQLPSGTSSLSVGSWQQQQHRHHHAQQQQQQQMVNEQWTGAGNEYITSQEPGWWGLGVMTGGSGAEFATHHHVNLASHAQHSGMPYEYAPMPDTSAAGLMIQMPQSRVGSHLTSTTPSAVGGGANGTQAFLAPPPLPPPPQPGAQPKLPASERPHRPPRAKSSGARHLSSSPMRRQRAPSASPTNGHHTLQHHPPPPAIPRSRHSSGASISSVRSASGRLPGSMPGTPCSVRKRRSRDVGMSSMDAGPGGGNAGGGGGTSMSGDIGFVNFTPSDGSLLMTGVAPSGSSKTKARREKEAQERRRRLSEAALKAVAAAGGDVEKLLEQGFAF